MRWGTGDENGFCFGGRIEIISDMPYALKAAEEGFQNSHRKNSPDAIMQVPQRPMGAKAHEANT